MISSLIPSHKMPIVLEYKSQGQKRYIELYQDGKKLVLSDKKRIEDISFLWKFIECQIQKMGQGHIRSINSKRIQFINGVEFPLHAKLSSAEKILLQKVTQKNELSTYSDVWTYIGQVASGNLLPSRNNTNIFELANDHLKLQQRVELLSKQQLSLSKVGSSIQHWKQTLTLLKKITKEGKDECEKEQKENDLFFKKLKEKWKQFTQRKGRITTQDQGTMTEPLEKKASDKVIFHPLMLNRSEQNNNNNKKDYCLFGLRKSEQTHDEVKEEEPISDGDSPTPKQKNPKNIEMTERSSFSYKNSSSCEE